MENHSFDANRTLPFLAFRALRKIAESSVGEAHTLDLSQGEPGYGFAPNVRSRKFYSFLLLLDTYLNDHLYQKRLFASEDSQNLEKILEEIDQIIIQNYHQEIAQQIKKDWDFFLQKLQEICQNQNLKSDKFSVIYELFKYSNLSGGRYPQPQGQPLLQAVCAEEYSQHLHKKVWYKELISVMGASHGIGATFKALGSEGIKYLHGGDYILMTSPVYAPYNALFQNRGIHVLSLYIDPETGEYDQTQIEKLKNFQHKIKALVLIDPNNPTGFASTKKFQDDLADIAETHNSLVITDEVYGRFFHNHQSISIHPKIEGRLIRIDSLSKIERSTGLRSGDIYLSEKANNFITQNILNGYLGDWENTFELLRCAKSPGGKNIGLFQHITGVPGPSVGLALSHLILGKEEREIATDMIEKKMEIFYENLGLERKGNFYYGLFDLERLAHPDWKKLDPEKKFEAIAAKGVVLMPANLFFSQSHRKVKDFRNFARVSLPNLSYQDTKRSAEIIREVMQNPPQ